MHYAHAGLRDPEYYVPGLPVDYVATRYGITSTEIAKLGSAENPHGPSPLARQAVADTLERLHLYPSWTADPLREKIADTYGYQPTEVICGAGETEIISLIIRAFCEPGGKILMPGPCFPIYHLFAEAEGRVPVLASQATD
ncbi:MAG: aminotransferase class I/II-fold pyridoxal phosphate-dependent enzyme, partial [Actinomycetia bacterium]|nr:aminotransferase class I/II-fold pyridoxal phosphate-dependent enzyme [Actinomycetes bacterium]